ncbi:MAG: DUF4393 domain-containing protein [candidate division Zixibacteria bacterium]|jgi:hypothetical protein|nr:DUF4393 domain-containing protein [candidate division Zixibacteria bacterium]
MDYISVALAKSGIPAAIEAAKDLLQKLAGPAAEETGLFLQDRVRIYRLRNQLAVLGKTQDMLSSVGIDPKSVPLRVLVPLLEGAALEDDDNLATKWAALLANAAMQGSNVNLIPSFSNILSQLQPRDAAILDILHKEEWYHTKKPENIVLFAFRPTIQKPLNLSDTEYELSVDNIVRLGLCVIDNKLLPPKVQKDLDQIKIVDPDLIRRDVLIATRLGFEFLKACSQPAKHDK